MKTSKRILALLLALVMCLALASCGGENANANANTNTDASSGETGSGEAEPVSNDIVVAAASLGSTLNPWDQVDGTTSTFQYAAYDRLVKYAITTDENGNEIADTSNVVGNLAESWETSDDSLTWTFHLNPNARFANGDQVTSEDVICPSSTAGRTPTPASSSP